METSTTLVIRKDDVVIKFELTSDGAWEAWRMIDQDPDKSYRLYDLDALDTTHAMTIAERFLCDDVPAIFLEKRESSIERRLNHG